MVFPAVSGKAEKGRVASWKRAKPMTEQPRIRVFCVDDHPLLRGNGDIAEKLFITEETARFTSNTSIEKLGASDRKQRRRWRSRTRSESFSCKKRCGPRQYS